jgi:hypothetical protein
VATYDLAITFPLPEGGAAGSGLLSGHKVFTYYPGITGRFFIGVGGAGKPPYTFSGSNLPSGATVDAETGEFVWVNPQTGSYPSVVLAVEDAEASTDSVTIDLDVTTTGFRFVDAVNGNNSNAGTSPAAPWQTLVKVHTDGGDNYIYYYSGTYTIDPSMVTTSVNGVFFDRVHWRQSSSQPTTHIAVPGETVIFDFESDHTSPTLDGGGTASDVFDYNTRDGGAAPFLRLEGGRIYVDGITFANTFNKALDIQRPTSGRGTYWINVRFEGHGHSVPVTGANKTALFFEHPGDSLYTYSDCFVNCYWSDLQSGPFIMYDMKRPYVAFNRQDYVIGECEAGPAYKGAPIQFNDYHNYWKAWTHCVGGDMSPMVATTPDEAAHGEFWFTHLVQTRDNPGDSCLQMNQFGQAARVWAERCTIEGEVRFLNPGTGDGPLGCTDCVVVNDGGLSAEFEYASYGSSVVPPTDITIITFEHSLAPTGTQNLAGTAAAGIIDANGLLQGAFRTAYLGLKGHEIAEAAEPEPDPVVGGPAFAVGGIF